MRYIAPFLVMLSALLAAFTAPDGTAVWVNASQVIAVGSAVGCAPGARTEILTSSGRLCVQERPADVVKVLEK